MDKEKSRRKFLWIYAVILFASAFAVLLLTAFSQIKLNSNVEEYKKKLSEHDVKIQGFDVSLNSAEKDRASLLSKIETLEKENNNLKSIATNGGNINFLDKVKKSNDNLIKADSLYRNNKKVLAAQVLKEIGSEDLGEQGKARYNYLKLELYEEATKFYYKQAKKEMAANNYSKAKEYFETSLSFDEMKYYEENSLFYLVLISSKMKDKNMVDSYIQKLKTSYPKSEYIKKAEKLKA